MHRSSWRIITIITKPNGVIILVPSTPAFLNAPILAYADEIRSAVLLIHGEKAHSRYFSEDTFKKLKDDNKELMIIPDAVHTDLYDRTDIIPFDKLEEFLKEYLK